MAKLLYRLTQVLALALLALSPFPMGSIHPLPRAVLVTAVLVLLLLWLARALVEAASWSQAILGGRVFGDLLPPITGAVASCVLVLALAFAQVAPVPAALGRLAGGKAWQARHELAQDLSPLFLPAAARGPLAGPSPFPRWGTVSAHPSESLRVALQLLACTAMMLVVFSHFRSSGEVLAFAVVITFVCLLLSAHGIVQHLVSPDRIYGFWRSDQGGRPFGPFVNENHFGGYLAMGLPVALSLALGVRSWRRRQASNPSDSRQVVPGRPSSAKRLARWLGGRSFIGLAAAAGVPVMVAALVMSRSRGGLAAFAAAAALLLAARAFRWGGSFRAAWGRTALIVLACLAAVWVVSELGGPLASGIQTAPKDLAHRARIWSSFIKVGVDFLPLGAGVGAFGAVSSAYADLDLTGERSPEGWFRHAENDYVEFFAETGPVGLLAAFAFLALVFRAVWIAWTHSESSRLRLNLMVGALAGLSASAVHSLVDFSLRMPSNGLLGAALAGLCLSIAVSLSRDWGTRRDETERVAPQDRSSWAFSADALPGRRGRVAIGALSVVLAAGLGWITWRPVWGAAAAEAAQGRLKDEPAKAIATLRWACRAQWRDPEAARLLGRALDPVVNPAAPVKPGSLEALAPYALSAWLAPFDSEARAQLAGAMQRAGTRGDVGAAASLLRDLALLHAQRALRLEPKSFDLRLSLAAAAKASGQADLAKGVVASLLREYPLRWRLVFDGLDASAGDLIMLRDAIPPGAPSHYRFAYHLELRRLPDLARQEYATACEMSAAEDIKERLVSVDRLADLGAADEALRFLDRWVRDHPRDTRYIARRAAVLLKAGQADRAADDYERLLERHPDSLKERLALAGIHERAGRLEQAEKHFRLAVENAPRLAAPYLEMARFQRRIGRPAQAIRTLKDMSGFDATNPAALLELGELYYEAGEVRRATDYFRQAEQHGVSAAEVRARIERAAAAAGRKPAQGPATP